MLCFIDTDALKKNFDRWAYSVVCVCVCFAQRMNTKLSSMQAKINESQSPLPLFTCLHVKPDVSELMFAGKVTAHRNIKNAALYCILIVVWIVELLAKLNEKDTATVRICIIPLHSLRGSWTLLICLHLLNTGENMQMLVMGPNDWPNVNSSWTFTGVDTIFRD